MKTRKCKYCKQPFEPSVFLQKNCFDPNCVAEWINDVKQKNWQKKKAKLKADLMTLSDYIKLAQQVFNKYIRLRDKSSLCISCQKKINGVEHASHYLSAGGHSNVRFHEDNVWTSCYKCNVMLSGNQIEYRKQLIIKIGVERVEWLEQNGSKEKKYSIEELKEIIKIYKAKCKELENI
jgi:hypothetical protein